ncbi:dihydropteroate synthase [Paenibacillus sp. IB182496]|uniref:Dihydropteroate synthase n=1 Tax=Paenibacillus sabuli TaxID=2772509 RepID=A0A927GUQ1_9BACL|nr:dihydropteroate synthase [Paenibacillus sabuli]MBD2848400.1 dihydropteroate synthase [Paenibacillus sabuli]
MRATIRRRSYVWKDGTQLALGERTLIMGILNVTPDSFSDGGRYDDLERAVRHARAMVDAGADIIDIGGESTRPGSAPVDVTRELARVLPTVRALAEAMPGVPLSIDTYKAETARQALQAGAHIINDIWGLQADPDMAAVAAAYRCPVVISHNRADTNYVELAHDVREDLARCAQTALSAGVEPARIWLDPGIGFAKSYEDNLRLMGQLDTLAELGYPLLLGTSRKRFIRRTLELDADEVVEGTAATVALGIAQGCQIVRVHDIAPMARIARMCDAIVYRQAQITE